MSRSMLVFALLAPLAACSSGDPFTTTALEPAAAVQQLRDAPGLVRREFPAEDPGAPFYARVGDVLDQYFRVDGWLVIPFYRDPACVPADFNLLSLFHPPGPAGPGAFACPLTVQGFFLTEADAPLGTFPRHVVSTGSAVPVWLVPWAAFEAAKADGVVTMDDLRAMSPLAGVARRFHETLHPRFGEHLVVISAQGTLQDGRAFNFSVTHVEERTTAIQLRLQ